MCGQLYFALWLLLTEWWEWWLHVSDEARCLSPTIGWPRPECPVHATGGAHISVGARELTGTDHHREEIRQQVLVTTSKKQKPLRSMWHLWSQKALEIKFLLKMRRKAERNICSLLIWRQKEETVWYFTKVSPILLIESVNFWHKINLCCKILRIGLKEVTQCDDSSLKIWFCKMLSFQISPLCLNKIILAQNGRYNLIVFWLRPST